MPSIEWVTPAPRWTTANGTLRQPQVLKLTGDQFLPDFLAAVQGQVPGVTPGEFLDDPRHGFEDPEDRDAQGNLKLFHPAHGRFHLVTGSLVCRQLGLPDRHVALADGERVSFVVRRLVERPVATAATSTLALAPAAAAAPAAMGVASGFAAQAAVGVAEQVLVTDAVTAIQVEQAWVDEGPQRGWRDLVDDKGRPVAVRPDEERFPLHPVSVSSDNGAGQRKLFYGYVAVGHREKYQERRPVAEDDPADALRQFELDVRSSSTVDGDYDFRMDELTDRVLEPWRGIYTATKPADRLDPPFTEKLGEFSLYLILDMADWLQRNLPEVFLRLTQGTPLPAGSKRAALVTELQQLRVRVNNAERTLAQAIDDLAPHLSLVRGQGEEPAAQFNVRDARRVAPGPAFDLRTVPAYLTYRAAPDVSLHRAFQEALAESPSPSAVSQEVVDLLQDQVVPAEPDPETAADGGVYVLRLVYERPECPPVVSQPTPPLTFARFFDPDAPARHIRIELPSIAMKDLRRYKRGVGMQMTPELRDVMKRVQKSMLDGDGLAGSAGGWELGMICSFSLQIIFLVAFIVMFIFLIAFNFIFWWLPFLKICFPIPKKK